MHVIFYYAAWWRLCNCSWTCKILCFLVMWWHDEGFPDNATNPPYQQPIDLIPLTSINQYYRKTKICMPIWPRDQSSWISPVSQGFTLAFVHDLGPEQLAFPYNSRFRIIKPKAQNCMDEDGTHINLQSARFIFHWMTLDLLFSLPEMKWEILTWKWEGLEGQGCW